MDPQNPESPAPIAASAAAEPELQRAPEPVGATEPAPGDARSLVDRMVAAGEWPEPELLEQIVAAGDAAVEPLLEVLRSRPSGWPEEAPLSHAMGLMSVMRPPAAIPELIEVLQHYPDESGEDAKDALGAYGPIAFEPLLEVCRDPAVTGYARSYAIGAARLAAGEDRDRRSRLAEIVRPLLADAIERAKEERRSKPLRRKAQAQEEDEDVANEQDFGDEEQEPQQELDPMGQVTFHVVDLAAMADPLARGLIKTAFDEKLVDRFLIDKKSVDENYRHGGEPPPEEPDWLTTYRYEYQAHLAMPNPPLPPSRVGVPRPEFRYEGPAESEEPESPPPIFPAQPIRNVGPKLGRNDPCWCGSGKKYKKCHLDKDTRT